MNTISGWSDVGNSARREILFEHRNKYYGAYEIRKNYARRLTRSLFFTLGITAIAFLAHYASGILNDYQRANHKVTDSVVLGEPPPIDKITPPPPPIEIPPPIQRTIRYTPPVVVQDEDAEEPPPTQDEVKNVQVAMVTQDGEDIIDLPTDPVIVQTEEEQIFTIVEEMPSFPGGDRKLLEMLSRIHYPQIARENGIAGSVYLSFIVEKDGKIKDVKVIKGIGGGCDEEALRVLLASPNWNPGKQNGRPVAVRHTVKVSFALQ